MLERLQDDLKGISEALKERTRQPDEVNGPTPTNIISVEMPAKEVSENVAEAEKQPDMGKAPPRKPVIDKRPAPPPKSHEMLSPEEKPDLNKLLREKGQASNLLNHLMQLTDYLPPPEKEEFQMSQVRNKMQNLIKELADRRRAQRGRRSEDPNSK
jgi:hypothetical protein